MFSIPSSILPKLVPTTGRHFGSCKLFKGADIPIRCCIADQSASMYGSGSFRPGSVKVTLGTGAFLDVNTGDKPHASVGGIYPLVGWKYGYELSYIAEGASHSNANVIEWGKSIGTPETNWFNHFCFSKLVTSFLTGLFQHVQESSDIAQSVPDSGGVYFIPAFQGLQAPYNDASAASGFLGVTEMTKKAHLVRALLESLAFRVQQLLNVLQSETDFEFDHIKYEKSIDSKFLDILLCFNAALSWYLLIKPFCYHCFLEWMGESRITILYAKL